MFTITSIRIVGLMAVVCAAIVAPQALAMPIIDSQNDAPTTNAIRGHERQDQYVKRLALAALAGGTTKSVKVQPESQWRSPIGQSANNTPGGFDLGDLKDRRPALTAATNKVVEAGSAAAAIKALRRRSVDLDSTYRKVYPGAYKQTVQSSAKAVVWSFPACGPTAGAEYESYIYSGDPCKI
jgi:hypothetical protein